MKKLVYVIGMGPGSFEQMTFEARRALEQSDVIVGYTVYVDLLREHFPEKQFLTTPMRQEVERCRMAFEEAKKAGLTYTIDEIKLRDAHPNTAVIDAESADGKTRTMQASSIGGGRIMVNKLDGIDVNFNGMFNTLVIRNEDASGTVAAVTSILSQLRINVANMSLYRHKRGGDALMVIELDQHLKPSQVAFLSELPGVLSMTYYDKEEDDDGSGFDEGNI